MIECVRDREMVCVCVRVHEIKHFWMLCGVNHFQLFQMITWFHIQGQAAQDILNLLLDPKDAETMILRHIRCYWPVTQCNIPEDLNLQ